jgi:hypothetical protein
MYKKLSSSNDQAAMIVLILLLAILAIIVIVGLFFCPEGGAMLADALSSFHCVGDGRWRDEAADDSTVG